MRDYAELVKALRCETSNGGECWEKKCQYLVCGSYAYCNAKRIMADAAAAIEALQAQLPKRGEWIEADGFYKCSVCGELECCRGKYCPDCGAKMMEVQE